MCVCVCVCVCVFYICIYAGLKGRVFTSGPVDLGSIPARVIPKTFKIVLDSFSFNTQQYKVRIMGNVEQYRERSIAFPYTSV